MENQILKELEATAQVLLAPPNLVTPEQRQLAERVFLEFRETKTPYIMCRQILETSSVDYVLFESAGLIKIALMREWSLLSKNDIISLKDYLLHYALSRPTLAPFVRERILQVIAIVVKRLTVEDSGENATMLFDHIESMVTTGDLQKKLLGCGLVSALMQEFATTVKSSDIGLSWEKHMQAKINFEDTQIRRIFKFFITALSEFTSNAVPEEVLSLIRHLLSITEGILTWDFVTSRRLSGTIIGLAENNEFLRLRRGLCLNEHWRELILDSTLIQLFFTLYSKVRINLSLAHYARTCLVTLASLNGDVVMGYELHYLNNYMQEFLKLVPNIEIIDQEALGIANIIRKLIVFFGSQFSSLSSEMSNSFMEQMVRLTRIFAEGAAQEETVCSDDYLYMDAFQEILDTWYVAFFTKKQCFKEENLEQLYIQTFDIFLKCKLSPPDGFRVTSNKDLETEIVDFEDDDKTRFKDQLQIIGHIGRKVPHHSLKLLAHLIEERTSILRHELGANRISAHFQNLQLTHQNSFMANNTNSTNQLNTYEEDLHWLVLLAGHVLCITSDGAMSMIPEEIQTYIIKQVTNDASNIDVSLRLLASPECNLSDIPGAEQSAEHVIRLIAAVFRLCEVERNAMEANMVHLLSPELIGTIVWFLNRWSMDYLLSDEDSRRVPCVGIVQAFGVNTEGAQWTFNFLLDNSRCIINAFKGEETIVNSVLQLLLVLVGSTEKASCVFKSEKIGHFIELITKNEFSLPQSAKRGLMSAIVRVGIALNEADKKQYFSQTIEPLQKKFSQILLRNDFSRTYHDGSIKLQITELFDYFIGVVGGFNKKGKKVVSSVFPFLQPMLTELPNLLSLYSNYRDVAKLILELLCDCSQTISYDFNKDENVRMYEIYLRSIQAYAGCNAKRLTTDLDEEENPFQDVYFIMQLLINILDESLYQNTDDFLNQQNILSADMFFCGLNFLVPMVSSESLKFPVLCNQYYKMISRYCFVYPEKVYTLPPELLKQLMTSIELGCCTLQANISDVCLEIVVDLARHICATTAKDVPSIPLLIPFMKLILNICLSSQTTVNLYDLSTPLFYLICCYPDEYQQLMGNCITTQTNPEIQQRLASAINELNDNININSIHFKSDTTTFHRYFETFLNTVRGFLIIK